MPLSDEQLRTELIALKEAMTDFRNEVRSMFSGFVRVDVYAAQQEAMKQLLTAQVEMLNKEIATLKGQLAAIEADKRQKNGIVWSALATAAVSMVVSLFKATH